MLSENSFEKSPICPDLVLIKNRRKNHTQKKSRTIRKSKGSSNRNRVKSVPKIYSCGRILYGMIMFPEINGMPESNSGLTGASLNGSKFSGLIPFELRDTGYFLR